MYNYEKWGCPSRHGPSLCFFHHNSGLQNQFVLYTQPAATLRTPYFPGRSIASARVLLDPNALSADGTAALSNAEVSRDGALLAYAISRSGSDWCAAARRSPLARTSLCPPYDLASHLRTPGAPCASAT